MRGTVGSARNVVHVGVRRCERSRNRKDLWREHPPPQPRDGPNLPLSVTSAITSGCPPSIERFAVCRAVGYFSSVFSAAINCVMAEMGPGNSGQRNRTPKRSSFWSDPPTTQCRADVVLIGIPKISKIYVKV